MDGLRIRMFGGLTLEANGRALPPIASRIGRSLFAYLVTHRDTSPTRDLLAGMFWPDMAEAQARRRLSHALWQIQSVLTEAGVPDGYVETSATTIRFNPDREAWVDVDEFDEALSLIKRDGGADLDAGSGTYERLVAALGLYTGDFLAGFYDDWILVEQERLRQGLFATLQYVVRLSKSRGDFEGALLYARRLALLDPLHEGAHREVMRMCYLLGRPNEALAQYERCASILSSEIGTTPASETTALRDRIADGRQTPVIPLTANSRARLFEAKPTPLVGRTDQRQEIITFMEEALAGHGGVVLLEGEPGAGKTRLLRESAEDANWRGLSVLWGDTTSEVTRPYGPLLEALNDGLTELRVRQLMERMDHVWLQALAPLLPGLQRWAPDLELGAGLRDGAEERQRVRDAFSQVFEALAQLTPTMLVLDDVHRADQDTLWALETLSADLSHIPLLICLSYRRLELQEQSDQWQAVRALDRSSRLARIGLEPLSAAEADQLVSRLLPEGTTGSLISSLHRATGGNPLFILETLRAVHEQQVSEALKPASAEPPTAGPLPLSGTVYDLIATRLDGLPAEPRHTARALAVSQAGLDIDSLAEVCDLPRPNMLDAVDYLIQAGMITTRSGRYALSHDQLAQVAYESMPPDERPGLHERLALRLESYRSVDADALGHHFSKGGVPDKAATYLEKAAKAAEAKSAFATARDRIASALEQARSADWSDHDLTRLLLSHELILEVLADREGQGRILDEVEQIARDPAQVAVAARRRALLLGSLGHWEESLPLARKALAMHEKLGDKTSQAEDLRVLGSIDYRRSHHESAIVHCQAALDLAPAGSTLGADIHHELSRSLIELQRFSEADAHLTTAEAWFARHQDRRGMAGALGTRALLNGSQGNHDSLDAHLNRAIQAAEDIGYGYGVAMSSLNLGLVHVITGGTAQAVAPTERARSILQAMGDQRGTAMAIANLASIHMELGDLAWAREFAMEALDGFRALEHGPGAALAVGTMAEIARREGDLGQADRHLGHGLDLAAGTDGSAARLQLRRTQAHVQLDRGDLAAGLETAQQTYAACHHSGLEWLLPDIAVVLARALVMSGRPEEALRVTAGGGPVSMELLYWRMEAEQALGNEGAAYEALEAAHDGLLAMLAGLSPDRTRECLSQRPMFRRLHELWEAARPQTITVELAAIGTPTGRPPSEAELVRVEWTIAHYLDHATTGGTSSRGRQILRLVQEAEEAGAAPTVRDLAAALGVSGSTVRREIEALRRAGHTVRTRGRRA